MLDEPDDMMIEDGWVETFDNLEVMIPEIRMIPMQAGNEGTTKTDILRSDVRQADVVAKPAQPLPAALMNPHGYNNGVPVSGYPPANAFAPTYPAMPVGPVKTSKGLDFNSVLLSNPALAASVGNVGGGPMNPGNMHDNTPTWARANNGGYPNTGYPNNPDPYGRPAFGQPNNYGNPTGRFGL
jgi:hypothetical protein